MKRQKKCFGFSLGQALFPNCLFSVFTDDDEKGDENASETTGHFQKLPRIQIPLTRTQVSRVL